MGDDLAGRAEALVGPDHLTGAFRGRHSDLARGGPGLGDGGFVALDRGGGGDKHQRPGSGEGGLDGGRRCFGGQGLHRRLEQRQVLGRTGHHVLLADRVDHLIGQHGRAACRGRGGARLEPLTIVLDLAIQLVLANAVLDQPALLPFSGLERRLPFAGAGRDGDGCHPGRIDLVTREAAGGDEGRFRPARDRFQPAVQHREGQLLDPVLTAHRGRIGTQVRGRDPADLQGGRGARFDDDLGLQTPLGHSAQIGIDASRGGVGPAAEGRLDLRLHGVDVEVAHGHQNGALRAIEGVVERHQLVARRRAQHLDLADRHAFGRSLAAQDEFQPRFVDPQTGTVARALLGQHHATFAINRVTGDQQFAGGLTQDLQRQVDGLVIGLWQVELVGRLVEVGRGVGVGAEGQTAALEHLDHLALGDALAAVEGHVFEKVGQTLLGVCFHQRAGVEPQPQGRLPGRGGVVDDGVTHAVGQGAETHVRISGDVTDRLGPLTRREPDRLGPFRRGRGRRGRLGARLAEGEFRQLVREAGAAGEGQGRHGNEGRADVRDHAVMRSNNGGGRRHLRRAMRRRQGGFEARSAILPGARRGEDCRPN